jgi:type IV pilus assembly protein PilM
MADNTFAVLNLGSQKVSAAVFAKTRSGELVLKQFDSAEMHGDPSAEATRLPQLRVAALELAEKLKLKGKDVWYAIAGHVVFTRFVKLPPFPDDKADQMVEFEARQNVPFPINEVIWDYEFIGEKGGAEREVALVAIKADALNDINDQIESAGINVVGVDLAPLAVYNSFRYSYPDVDDSALIVDLGARSTNLVFIEGPRVFTRNILVGGGSVTNAIAKEFGVSFGEAENNKRTKGFIAPGGAYEPHEDEEVDAISKIMRNTMTRLHGEVVRTINYYRTQQGGNAPRRIFICGGGANAGLAAEFFAEKFNLPVEVLNPLRGVQLDKRVDAEVAESHGATMAELVGLALRHSGAAPVEVELVPDTVAKSRDTAKRMPYLVMAMLSLFALLGVGVFYFNTAKSVVQSKLDELAAKKTKLEKDKKSIDALSKTFDLLAGQSAQFEQAVQDRGYWNRLLSSLNAKFQNDSLWLTQIEVLKGGGAITPPLLAGGQNVTTPQPVAPVAPASGAKGAAPAAPAYELRVSGLYRSDGDHSVAEVNKYFDDVKAMSELFDKTDNKPDADNTVVDDRFAYGFKFRLPLAAGMNFQK